MGVRILGSRVTRCCQSLSESQLSFCFPTLSPEPDDRQNSHPTLNPETLNHASERPGGFPPEEALQRPFSGYFLKP